MEVGLAVRVGNVIGAHDFFRECRYVVYLWRAVGVLIGRYRRNLKKHRRGIGVRGDTRRNPQPIVDGRGICSPISCKHRTERTSLAAYSHNARIDSDQLLCQGVSFLILQSYVLNIGTVRSFLDSLFEFM